jgi:hypothetical protein
MTTETHPLTGEDYTLIQDYLLTKIVLALNAHLDSKGWDHEIDVLQRDSRTFWVRRNALLFDYTLARLLAASALSSAVPDPSVTGPNESFIRDFVSAVSHQDPIAAESLWAEANNGSRTGDGVRLPSTIPLLARLRLAWEHVDARTVLDNLPDELFPAQNVS